MKRGAALMVLILLLPAVFATHTREDITISEFSKHIYNLGDVLTISYIAVQDSDTSAIFKLKLECGSYSLDYFTQPVELTAHEPKTLAASGLTMQKPMMGTCSVNASLFSASNEIITTKSSDSFVVTPDLDIEAGIGKESYLPGDAITASVNITPTYKGFEGSGTFEFGGAEETVNISGAAYEHAFKTGNTTKTGKHDLSIAIRDSFGNRGERIIPVKIDAIPTKLKISLNKDAFKPLEDVRTYVSLTDQAEDEMAGQATVIVINPQGTRLMNETAELGKVFALKLGQDAAPGNYTILAAVLGLEHSSSFIVNEVEQIEAGFDNRIVRLTNNGNVNYQKPVNISLVKEGKAYFIVRKLDLAPQKQEEIDLFRELPEGSYNLTIAGMAVYDNVQIQDERPIGKKIGDALPLTGNSVKGGGSFAIKTFFFLLAFLIAAGLTIGAIRIYRNHRQTGEKEKMQLEKELEAAKSAEKPRQPEAPKAKAPVSQKTQPLREDPEIRKFVDRVLREK